MASGWKDQHGYGCTDWVGYTCFETSAFYAEWMMEEVRDNCRACCGRPAPSPPPGANVKEPEREDSGGEAGNEVSSAWAAASNVAAATTSRFSHPVDGSDYHLGPLGIERRCGGPREPTLGGGRGGGIGGCVSRTAYRQGRLWTQYYYTEDGAAAVNSGGKLPSDVWRAGRSSHCVEVPVAHVALCYAYRPENSQPHSYSEMQELHDAFYTLFPYAQVRYGLSRPEHCVRRCMVLCASFADCCL